MHFFCSEVWVVCLYVCVRVCAMLTVSVCVGVRGGGVG